MVIKLYKTVTPVDRLNKMLTNEHTITVNPRGIVDPYNFKVQLEYNASLMQYNYAIIESWGIKYFVDKEFEGKMLNLILSCDSIATARAEILASTGHIVRSTSNGDAYISDPMVTVKPVTRTVTRKIGTGWGTGDYYILTIGGK